MSASNSETYAEKELPVRNDKNTTSDSKVYILKIISDESKSNQTSSVQNVSEENTHNATDNEQNYLKENGTIVIKEDCDEYYIYEGNVEDLMNEGEINLKKYDNLKEFSEYDNVSMNDEDECSSEEYNELMNDEECVEDYLGSDDEYSPTEENKGKKRKKSKTGSQDSKVKKSSAGWFRHTVEFQEEWLEKFPFVEYDPEKKLMYCKICKKYAYGYRRDSVFITGNNNFRASVLKYHERSQYHIECQQLADALSCEDSEHLQKDSNLFGERLIPFFKSAYFVLKNRMPYMHFPQLCKSQEEEGTFFDGYSIREKAAPYFGKYIAMSFEKDLASKISNLSVFSLIIDASLRRHVESHELVYIKYLDGYTVQTVFLGVLDTGAKLHDSVYSDLNVMFKRYNIENWNDKIAYLMIDRSDSHLWLDGLIALIKVTSNSNFVTEVNYLPHKIKYCGTIAENHRIAATFNAFIWKLYAWYEKVDVSKRNLVHMNEALSNIMDSIGNLPKNFFNALYFETLNAVEKDYVDLIPLLEEDHRRIHVKVLASKNRIKYELKRSSFICKLAFFIDIYSCLKDFSDKLNDGSLLPYDIYILLEEVCSDIQKVANGEGSTIARIVEELSVTDGYFRDIEIIKDSDMKQILASLQDFASNVILYIQGLVDVSFLEKSYIFNVNLWPEDEGLNDFGNSEFEEISLMYMQKETAQDALSEWVSFKIKVSSLFPPEVKQDARSVLLKMVLEYSKEFPLVTDLLSKILLFNFDCDEIKRGYREMCMNKSLKRAMLSYQSVQIMMMISMHGPDLGEFDCTSALNIFLNGDRRFCRRVMDKNISTNLACIDE